MSMTKVVAEVCPAWVVESEVLRRQVRLYRRNVASGFRPPSAHALVHLRSSLEEPFIHQNEKPRLADCLYDILCSPCLLLLAKVSRSWEKVIRRVRYPMSGKDYRGRADICTPEIPKQKEDWETLVSRQGPWTPPAGFGLASGLEQP
jgi:hypothetical protein